MTSITSDTTAREKETVKNKNFIGSLQDDTIVSEDGLQTEELPYIMIFILAKHTQSLSIHFSYEGFNLTILSLKATKSTTLLYPYTHADNDLLAILKH